MAHSEAELDEWNHRYAVRKQQLQQSQGTRAQGGTVIEQLVEKFMSQEHPKLVVRNLIHHLSSFYQHVQSDPSREKKIILYVYGMESSKSIHYFMKTYMTKVFSLLRGLVWLKLVVFFINLHISEYNYYEITEYSYYEIRFQIALLSLHSFMQLQVHIESQVSLITAKSVDGAT